MDLLRKAYTGGAAGGSTSSAPSVSINAAPPVPIRVVEGDLRGNALEVYHNPRADALYAPLLGPQQPFGASEAQRAASLPSGNVETHDMEQWAFNAEVNSSRGKGVARDPQTGQEVTVERKNKTLERGSRAEKGDASSDRFLGPWAQYQSASAGGGMSVAELEELGRQYEMKKRQRNEDDEQDGGDKAAADAGEAAGPEKPSAAEAAAAAAAAAAGKKKTKKSAGSSAAAGGPPGAIPCSVISEPGKDYLGRTWMAQHECYKVGADHRCYVPKSKQAKLPLQGKQSVNRLRWHPEGAHLLLSCGNDGACRIWGVQQGKRKELGQYWGHSKGVKEAVFLGPQGSQMASLGYDKLVRIWDVETGAALRECERLESLGFCLQHHPTGTPNEILVGCQNNKILQFDVRTAQHTQSYERHLDSVNSITFFEGGRRFISSSDDKTLRYWDYGIPVEIKIVQEPHMHSMPCATAHQGIGWAAFQSLDNQIVLYGIDEANGFKLNRKKRFLGHLVAGHACGLDFSTDGQFIVSGDSEGKLFFWDFKSSKVVRKLSGGHTGPVNSVLWHPVEQSRVVSAGADGKIIFWD